MRASSQGGVASKLYRTAVFSEIPKTRGLKGAGMLKVRTGTLASSLVALSLLMAPISQAQYHHDNHHDNFYNGARQGGRDGYYDHGRDYDGRYQSHGVGTGRGALIGGAGGAALGAVFGGGLKGALIGGGAGAGIGAIAGHSHQQTMKRHYYERRDGYDPR